MWRILACLLAGAFIAGPVFWTPVSARAGDAPPAAKSQKPATKGKRSAVHGTVKAVDKVAMTITTAGKSDERTLQITSRTRLFKGGKPATLGDAVVGDAVSGNARETADGKWEAVSVRLGLKTEGEPAPKKPKKAAPAAKPETK